MAPCTSGPEDQGKPQPSCAVGDEGVPRAPKAQIGNDPVHAHAPVPVPRAGCRADRWCVTAAQLAARPFHGRRRRAGRCWPRRTSGARWPSCRWTRCASNSVDVPADLSARSRSNPAFRAGPRGCPLPARRAGQAAKRVTPPGPYSVGPPGRWLRCAHPDSVRLMAIQNAKPSAGPART